MEKGQKMTAEQKAALKKGREEARKNNASVVTLKMPKASELKFVARIPIRKGTAVTAIQSTVDAFLAANPHVVVTKCAAIVKLFA